MLRLEKNVREQAFELSDEQIRALERFSPEFRERHIETSHTGDLVAVDTFFVGTLKGVGKVYLQSVIDCYSRYAWGKLYTNKLPVTAVHVLNEDVLPFFEEALRRIEWVSMLLVRPSSSGGFACNPNSSLVWPLVLFLPGR